MHALKATHRNIVQLAYGWDSGTLLGVSRDGKNWDDCVLDRWNLGDGTRAVVDCGNIEPTHASPLPDGRIVVGGIVRSSEGFAVTAAVIDPTETHNIGYLPPEGASTITTVSPIGNRILTTGAGRGFGACVVAYPYPFGTVIRPEWNVKVAPQKGRAGSFVASVAFAFGLSGERFLSIENTSELDDDGIRSLARWRAMKDGQPVGKPVLLGDFPFPFQFAVAGTWLILFQGATLIRYDLTTPSDPVKRVNRSRKHFTGLAVHPDGKRVLATNSDGTVREYDAVTLQELRAYDWKIGKPLCVAVAPDGLTAAVGSDTGKVVVWDLE